jgi:hypothetical protein
LCYYSLLLEQEWFLSQESTLMLEGHMPKQTQSDIPSPDQIRADDAFLMRVTMITAVASLFGAIGYGLTCWACWALSGQIDWTNPAHSDSITLGTLGFLVLGVCAGLSLTRHDR